MNIKQLIAEARKLVSKPQAPGRAVPKEVVDLETKILKAANNNERVADVKKLSSLDPANILAKYFMKHLDTVSEARVPGLEYEEDKVKTGENKDKIKSLKLNLSGNDSAIMTKVMKKYKEVDTLIKESIIIRDGLNADMKEQFADLWDADDIFHTRIIETKSAIATLAKVAKEEDFEPEDSYKWNKIAEEVFALLDDDLLKRANEIKNAYKTTSKFDPEEAKSPALRVKVKESVGQGAIAKFKEAISKYATKLGLWGESYDVRLNKINDELRAFDQNKKQYAMGEVLPTKTKQEKYNRMNQQGVGGFSHPDTNKTFQRDESVTEGIFSGKKKPEYKDLWRNKDKKAMFDTEEKIAKATDAQLQKIVTKGDVLSKQNIRLDKEQANEYRSAVAELKKRKAAKKNKVNESSNFETMTKSELEHQYKLTKRPGVKVTTQLISKRNKIKNALDNLKEKVNESSDELPFDKAKKELRALGISLKHDYKEYRVNFINGTEATAYYTDDLQDAIGTGKHMAIEKKTVKECSAPNKFDRIYSDCDVQVIKLMSKYKIDRKSAVERFINANSNKIANFTNPDILKRKLLAENSYPDLDFSNVCPEKTARSKERLAILKQEPIHGHHAHDAQLIKRLDTIATDDCIEKSVRDEAEDYICNNVMGLNESHKKICEVKNCPTCKLKKKK